MTVVDMERVLWRRQQVVEMTRQGLTAVQIGFALGITERSVVRHRRAAGVSLRSLADPMTPEELERAQQLLDDGCSYAEVGRTLGRAARTLRNHFPNQGWDEETMREHLAALRRCKVQMTKHQGVFK